MDDKIKLYDGRVPRLLTFPERPDCLMVYLPRGELQLPLLGYPISRESIQTACSKANVVDEE